MSRKKTVKGLKERLDNGEMVLCAEGYLFEIERRGYLKAGVFVPEVVLEHPEIVRALHEEFVHAGSDVVEAFTFYSHREKLRHISKEDILEELNRSALRIAKDVAERTGTLMAGNICTSVLYDRDPTNPVTIALVKQMFKEQVEWAVEEGADFIIAETFYQYGEAELALEAILAYGKGLPAVVNLAAVQAKGSLDGVDFLTGLERLRAKGALVVGLNCNAGPETMTQYMTDIRKSIKTGHLAALPVPYRTDAEHPVMFSLHLPEGERAFFPNLDYFYSPQKHIRVFGEAMKAQHVQFVGICCGNSARHFRALAESVGRTPPASRYSSDMSQHYILGDDMKIKAGVPNLVNAWAPVSQQK